MLKVIKLKLFSDPLFSVPVCLVKHPQLQSVIQDIFPVLPSSPLPRSPAEALLSLPTEDRKLPLPGHVQSQPPVIPSLEQPALPRIPRLQITSAFSPQMWCPQLLGNPLFCPRVHCTWGQPSMAPQSPSAWVTRPRWFSLEHAACLPEQGPPASCSPPPASAPTFLDSSRDKSGDTHTSSEAIIRKKK